MHYRVWASIEGIDESYGRYFDHVVQGQGRHPAKLNTHAREISSDAAPDDLLMFLDGDAFPFADPRPLIERRLEEAPLVAVRRSENCDEQQPHPCFCVTSVAMWRDLQGDWSDAGNVLLRQLHATNTPWSPVTRSNSHDLHPLFFAIYGNTIYHHGAGFRVPLSSVDVERIGGPEAARDPARRQEVEATVNRNSEHSQRLLDRIERDDRDWLKEILGGSAGA